MDLFTQIVAVCSGITSIAALVMLCVKPLREWALGIKQIRDGQKCLLRSEMLRIYWQDVESKRIRQYDFENFMLMYSAYKALIGNSFVDKIKDEVKTWEVYS